MIFWEVLLRVMEGFRVRYPGGPTTKVVEIIENGEVVIEKVESDTFSVFMTRFDNGQ